MEDNKLIAEFMEVHEIMHDGYSEYDFDDNTLDVVHEDELQYHKEWNWLMPVVDKIETIHGVYRRGGLTNGGQMHNAKDTKYIMEYGRYNKCIAHSYAQDRLSAEYNAIVEFIKFYNKNNIRQNG